jgi:hypothetical protein
MDDKEESWKEESFSTYLLVRRRRRSVWSQARCWQIRFFFYNDVKV